MTKLGGGGYETYAAGTWGDVVGLSNAAGVVAATEYLDGLSPSARAKFQVTAEKLAAEGRVSNSERFHKVKADGDPAVWEIKVHEGRGHRFYCVQRGRTWLITHGGQKPRNNTLYGTEVTRCRNALVEWDAQ